MPIENSEYGKNIPRPFALKANPKIPAIIEIPTGTAKLLILNDNVSWSAILGRLPIEPRRRSSMKLEGIGSVNPDNFPHI